MEELKKEMEEKRKKLQKKVDLIQQKTNKTIKFNYDFNKPYIEIDNKKIEFVMPGVLDAYISGMYKITKDL